MSSTYAPSAAAARIRIRLERGEYARPVTTLGEHSSWLGWSGAVLQRGVWYADNNSGAPWLPLEWLVQEIDEGRYCFEDRTWGEYYSAPDSCCSRSLHPAMGETWDEWSARTGHAVPERHRL